MSKKEWLENIENTPKKFEEVDETLEKVKSSLNDVSKQISSIEVTAEKTKLKNPNFKSADVNGGMNELFQYANDIKSKWNNVLGTNLTSTNSSEEYKNHTQWCKNKLVGNLGEKGVGAASSESLSGLVDKVNNIEIDHKINFLKWKNLKGQLCRITKDRIYSVVGKNFNSSKSGGCLTYDLNGTLLNSIDYNFLRGENEITFFNGETFAVRVRTGSTAHYYNIYIIQLAHYLEK